MTFNLENDDPDEFLMDVLRDPNKPTKERTLISNAKASLVLAIIANILGFIVYFFAELPLIFFGLSLLLLFVVYIELKKIS